VACLALACRAPGAAQAQEPASREAQILAQQAERSRSLTPQGPNKAERLLERIEPVVLAREPSGFYPWFGIVLGGGWVGSGAGYRTTFADTGKFTVFGGWSLKNYRTIDGTLQVPAFFDGRARLTAYGKYLFADKVAFYGLGPDTSKDDVTSFTWEPTTLGADLVVEVLPYVFVEAGYGGEITNTGPGNEGTSIEEAFTPEEVPGLGVDTAYGVARASLAIDWRESPGYTTRGGLYRFEFRRYDERDGKPYDFDWAEAEVRQFLPILRGNWVLAFRGLATVTYGRDGSEVPYSMMPTLGSSRYLRGFSNRRFRDVNRLLAQGEVRWRSSRFMDLAVFYDAGKVASSRGDLDLKGLSTSWGGGVRLHGPAFTAFRAEVARSREGWKYIFASEIF
jgi:hypothetical protein